MPSNLITQQIVQINDLKGMNCASKMISMKSHDKHSCRILKLLILGDIHVGMHLHKECRLRNCIVQICIFGKST